MALIEFEKEEIELIKKALSKRQKVCKTNAEFYDKHYNEIEIIFNRLDKYFIDLTPMQKAIITGCLKDFIDYNNNEFLRLTDYEIFKIKRLRLDEINDIDTALILFKKLKDKAFHKRPTIHSIIENINKILDSEKVCYSILNDGKIYKTAIMISQSKGLRVEMEGALLEYIKFESISEDSYMFVDKPISVIEKLNKYGIHNTLTENQDRVLQLLSYNDKSKNEIETK